jgi:2-aminobenzoate-CoA ligase
MSAALPSHSAHVDTFARDNLPPVDEWPDLLVEEAGLSYPERLNCAVALLDDQVAAGNGDRPAFVTPNESLTYRQLQQRVDRIAHVLTADLGLVPGNRVLLRAANNPMLVASWLAVAKAGGVVVATMPLLRSRELAEVIQRAQIRLALCDRRLTEELDLAIETASICERVCTFDGSGEPNARGELEQLMERHDEPFTPCDTAADDVVLIAFTSGTTGRPKGTMHFHRDVLAICDTFSAQVLKPHADDVFIGSPPIAFTFGMGGIVTFPMRVGASAVLLEAAPPDKMLEAIDRFGVTVVFTAPTAYRRMLSLGGAETAKRLRRCVSAGETLPAPVSEAWFKETGIRIIDGIGATEMLHIFISAADDEARPGATGKAVPGYEARVVDDDMRTLPAGEIGRLAVRGPTGCRYLADPRQREYVVDGWNLTGDAYLVDDEGYFRFQARTDDMIITLGYNVSGPEVETVLLEHPDVLECAVVAANDPERGTVVKACVVPAASRDRDHIFVTELQEFCKARIAPYKSPRQVEFLDALPRTETGKVQRFVLRQRR